MSERIPDSHKSAFWIYGVTALVMREPLSVLIRDTSALGLVNPTVQLEALRVVLVFLILSRLFLGAGVYFDRVYLQPESAGHFPRRSYPVDFLSTLMELLVAVGASTAVGIHTRHIGGLAPFSILIAILLLFEPLKLALAWAGNYSTVAEIAPTARANAIAFLLADAIYMTLHIMGFGPAWADAAALTAVAVCTLFLLLSQIRTYGSPLPASTAR